MKKKIIIDCDVGVDDALALILAFHSPELEIGAVTGVNGNVSLEQVFANIQKVLFLIQPQHHPFIARGADRPLKGIPTYAHSVHGEDGLGGVKIDLKKEEKWWHLFSGPAHELITEMARQHPDELTLIAIGPLTNLALALQKDLPGMKKLKELVIMGGAVRTQGNITPHAEFNIFVDPLAAQMVLASGLPITLVPLDVTHRVFLSSRLIEERIKPLSNPFGRFVTEATGYSLTSQRFRRGSEVFHLHDPLAVAVAIDPDLVRKERLSILVEIEEGERYGQTFEVAEEEASAAHKLDVCLGVNSEKFLELFLSRLGA
ncbi:MAG: nucleoside hydrolase [Deltaproteobacteria bacterium]|nr:nucleoside hydrolase [Deltaproteobacteria bacterium]